MEANAQDSQQLKAKEVNVGWASIQVELRDIATDELIEGGIDVVDRSTPMSFYPGSETEMAVFEAFAPGYVGSREHLFVASPGQDETYKFVIYLRQPQGPPPGHHMAQID